MPKSLRIVPIFFVTTFTHFTIAIPNHMENKPCQLGLKWLYNKNHLKYFCMIHIVKSLQPKKGKKIRVFYSLNGLGISDYFGSTRKWHSSIHFSTRMSYLLNTPINVWNFEYLFFLLILASRADIVFYFYPITVQPSENPVCRKPYLSRRG